ncbi:MAG: hypothetical protein IPM36_17130 [Lewinellaceae bacterium]|nr:hypothetical protein [Lewinellaceae bacterium]
MKNHFVLVLAILILSGCASAKRDYNAAKTSNKIGSYEAFLRKHPKSKYTVLAQKEVRDLYEVRDWTRAIRVNSISEFKLFIQNYPFSSRLVAKRQIVVLEEKDAWAKARKLHTISAYEEFIRRYPASTNVKDARNYIEEIDWASIQKTNTISAYEGFIQRYPNSTRLSQAKQKIEEIDWKQTQKIDQIESYQNFQNLYPDSRRVADAERRILEIQDDKAWQNASLLDTPSSYRNYLVSYAYGRHSEDANRRIREYTIVRPAWEKAKKKNTIVAYEGFIEKYPNSDYALLAREKIKAFENSDWRTAKSKNTIDAFRRFLAKHPYSKYSSEAEKLIIDLEVNKIFSKEHGMLPPMSRTSFGDRYRASNDITILNKTSYVLTVWYSGVESVKIVLNPGGQTNVTLPNGNYKVAASVKASGVIPFAGKETLEGGDYSSQFYIETRRSSDWRY